MTRPRRCPRCHTGRVMLATEYNGAAAVREWLCLSCGWREDFVEVRPGDD